MTQDFIFHFDKNYFKKLISDDHFRPDKSYSPGIAIYLRGYHKFKSLKISILVKQIVVCMDLILLVLFNESINNRRMQNANVFIHHMYVIVLYTMVDKI